MSTTEYTPEQYQIAGEIALAEGWHSAGESLLKKAAFLPVAGKLFRLETGHFATVDGNMRIWMQQFDGEWSRSAFTYGDDEPPVFVEVGRLVATPEPASEPLVFDSLASAPVIKKFRDNDGDIWEHNSNLGWGYRAGGGGSFKSVARPANRDAHGPFTEVIEEEA